MNVLFIASEAWEMRYIPRRPGWQFAANGAGPGRASEVVTGEADVVLSVGLCGALDRTLRVADVIVATAVNGAAIDTPAGAKANATGPVASVERIVGTAVGKQQLAATGAIAVEMEAAGVLDRTRALGKKFYCIKAVSDTADEGFVLDLNAALDERGRFSVMNILAQTARRPFATVPELLRLWRNSRAASRALGDFFEHCSF